MFGGRGNVDVVQRAWLCVPGCCCNLELKCFLAGYFLPLILFPKSVFHAVFPLERHFPFPFVELSLRSTGTYGTSFPFYTVQFSFCTFFALFHS